MAGLHVAIVGATGAVGEEFLRLLELRNYPVKSLRVLASERSAGKKLKYAGRELVVEKLGPGSFEGIDYAFFSAGGSISREFAPHAAAAGAIVIDNTSAFRLEPDVPLVVPEINPKDALEYGARRIIAVPNCTTIVALMPAYPLHKAFSLKRAVMSSYQAISGAGTAAMAELEQQTRDWAAGKPLEVKISPKQIAFNVIPRIDAMQDNGYTKEEMKFLWEGRKIMHHETLRATATCVRVPVLRCHSVSLNLEFEKPVTPAQAREVLREAPGVILQDDPRNEIYPVPLECAGRAEIAVGRIRQDISIDGNRGLALWAVGDQLMKGAALNAIQIGELLLNGK